jgi:hypothetical protein
MIAKVLGSIISENLGKIYINAEKKYAIVKMKNIFLLFTK